MNINEKVHELYWDRNMNCARTALICLGEIFGIEYDAQILPSAVGLHGAGAVSYTHLEVKEMLCSRLPFKKVYVVDAAGVSTTYANDGGIVVTI